MISPSRIYTAKGKNSPASRISEIGALKTKIIQTFGGGDQHAIGKKWTQNAPFASIFLKISRGRSLDPHLQEGDIHSRIYSAKGKNSPHHVYRSGALKTKITQKFEGGGNQHAIGKKWTQNAPFASIFLKISRGRPPDPHLREGVSPSHTLPLRRFAPIWLRPPGSGPSGSATGFYMILIPLGWNGRIFNGSI